MAHEFQNFKSTTLSASLAAAATSATLTAANFTDFTDGYLVVDYDNPSKREVIRCTVSGTSVSSITRGQDGTSDVAHDAGAKVIWSLLATHLEEITSGWKLANEAWAYASATTITVPSGAASRYSVGCKIKITQTTVKYFYVTGVADTVLTVTGGSDYTVANAAITDNYYSNVSSPVGFPQWFNFSAGRAVDSGTAPTYTANDVSKFMISGRTLIGRLSWKNSSGGTAGNGAAALTFTTPVTPAGGVDGIYTTYGVAHSYEDSGTTKDCLVQLVTGSTMRFAYDGTQIVGNDQSSTARGIGATYQHEI